MNSCGLFFGYACYVCAAVCSIVGRTLKEMSHFFNRPDRWNLFAVVCVGLILGGAPVMAVDSLFADPVIVKAKTFQIRESDLQEAYVGYKAAAIALGQPTPPAMEEQLKAQLLDKMIA